MDDSPAPFILFKAAKPDVYELALELVGLVHDILERAESTRYHMKDRLDRSTTAIAMQLANASDEPASARWRAYRRTLDLVTDCATMLDILTRQGCPAIAAFARARDTIARLQTELAPLALRGN